MPLLRQAARSQEIRTEFSQMGVTGDSFGGVTGESLTGVGLHKTTREKSAAQIVLLDRNTAEKWHSRKSRGKVK